MVGIIVCKIMKVIKTEDKVIIDCLVENMGFVNAKSFQIIDENQKSFVTKKFEIDKPRSCFSVSKCIWVILKSDVPLAPLYRLPFYTANKRLYRPFS